MDIMNGKTMYLMLALGVACGFSSCSMSKPGDGLAAYDAYDRPAKMPQNPSAVRVKVSLSKQRVYVMEGNEMLLAMPCSVGKPESPTPTGSYRIFNKDATRRANTHGLGRDGDFFKQMYLKDKPSGWSFKGSPMPYWCEFKPAYGFHIGWLKHTPCTHGCIRLHKNLAPKFYRLVSIGTPVNISYNQAEDAQWASMDLPPDAGPLPDYPKPYYWNGDYFTDHKTPAFAE
jgi:hypothetical protein